MEIQCTEPRPEGKELNYSNSPILAQNEEGEMPEIKRSVHSFFQRMRVKLVHCTFVWCTKNKTNFCSEFFCEWKRGIFWMVVSIEWITIFLIFLDFTRSRNSLYILPREMFIEFYQKILFNDFIILSWDETLRLLARMSKFFGFFLWSLRNRSSLIWKFSQFWVAPTFGIWFIIFVNNLMD